MRGLSGYEVLTGWRYLRGGRRGDRALVRLALLALAGAAGGAIATAAGATVTGGVVVVVSLLAAATLALVAVLPVFTAFSVLGVALGVAALTVVLAVTTGFQREFRAKILGVNAHVIVRHPGAIHDPEHVQRLARAIDPEVVATQPFTFVEAIVTRGRGTSSGVAIKGIDPALAAGVLELDDHLVLGSLAALGERTSPPPLLVGHQLAATLEAKLGDTVRVAIPSFDIERGVLTPPRTREFRIAGIFHSGFDEYDRRLVYASLRDTGALAGRDDEVMGVELRVADPDRAPEIAAKLEAALGAPHDVVGWLELNHNVFTVLDAQKAVLVLILTLIIVVAAVNLVASLVMLVADKRAEIAILKSMGSTTRGIGRIFRMVGLAIGAIGTAIGLVLGLVTCHLLGEGWALDPRVYMLERLPIEVVASEVAVIAGVAIVICWLATLAPARDGARLAPVEGLRLG